MDYKSVIKDYNNGTLDKKSKLFMDNDDGYWTYDDPSMSEDEQYEKAKKLEQKYGCPDGYRDIVDILRAAGVNCYWC